MFSAGEMVGVSGDKCLFRKAGRMVVPICPVPIYGSVDLIVPDDEPCTSCSLLTQPYFYTIPPPKYHTTT